MKLIRDRLPNSQRAKPGLLRRASELRLPKNPLVRLSYACSARIHPVTCRLWVLARMTTAQTRELAWSGHQNWPACA